jgi:4-amino-4-deoxy-L-arabinose transferase-like glycosyltransferase
VLCGAAALLFPALGSTGMERAEIYFLDGARAMLESGDWLVPHYRGEPFFDKPPLTYWLMAASMKLFGPTAAAGRAVSGVAALGMLLATAWLGRRLLDRHAALAGAIVLATSVAFMSFGRVAMSDMLLALFSTIAVALGVRAWQTPAAWIGPALGLVLGLGFLAKGPIAVLLPGLGLLLLWRQKRAEPWPFRPAGLALAALAFAVVGLGWFALVYARLGAAPLEHFFLQENLQRFAASTYDSGRSPFFYLGAYAAMGAPWSLVLPLAALRTRREAGVPFLLIWVGLMLVPLSLSRGKIDYYLLPLLPALSLVIGRFVTRGAFLAWERRILRAALVLLAATLLASPLALRGLHPDWIGPNERLAATAVAMLGAGVLFFAAWKLSAKLLLGAVAAVSGAAALVWVALLVPSFMDSQPNRRIVRDVERLLQKQRGARVVLCQDPTRVQRDILFETRTAVEERCDLWNAVSVREPVLMLARADEWSGMRRSRRLRAREVYSYLPANVLTLDRLSTATPARLFLVTNEGRHTRHRAGTEGPKPPRRKPGSAGKKQPPRP